MDVKDLRNEDHYTNIASRGNKNLHHEVQHTNIASMGDKDLHQEFQDTKYFRKASILVVNA